jgi:hypothetical protein
MSLYFGFVFVPVMLVFLVPKPLNVVKEDSEEEEEVSQNRVYKLLCVAFIALHKWCRGKTIEEDQEDSERVHRLKQYEKDIRRRKKYVKRYDTLGKRNLLPVRPISVVPVTESEQTTTTSRALERHATRHAKSSSTKNPLMPSRDEIPEKPIDIQIYEE